MMRSCLESYTTYTSMLYLRRHEVSKPAYTTFLQSSQLSLLIEKYQLSYLELPQSGPENNVRTYFYILLGFSKADFTGGDYGVKSCFVFSALSKYLGIAAAKLDIKHLLSLMA